MRTVAIALVLSLTAVGAARAQTAPPPAEIPRPADVPLPEWRPAPLSLTRPLVLGVSHDLRRAERLRVAGLTAAAFGLASLLAGGITEAEAVGLAESLRHPRDGQYHPEIDERRYAAGVAATSLLTVGAVLSATGFTLYAIGQTRINRWHQRHPRDELPPLSGF